MVLPYADLESCARQTAHEMIEPIVREANSVMDVSNAIQQILNYLCDEWSRIDWNEYAAEFGTQPILVPVAVRNTPPTQIQVQQVREFLESLLLTDNEEST